MSVFLAYTMGRLLSFSFLAREPFSRARMMARGDARVTRRAGAGSASPAATDLRPGREPRRSGVAAPIVITAVPGYPSGAPALPYAYPTRFGEIKPPWAV